MAKEAAVVAVGRQCLRGEGKCADAKSVIVYLPPGWVLAHELVCGVEVGLLAQKVCVVSAVEVQRVPNSS